MYLIQLVVLFLSQSASLSQRWTNREHCGCPPCPRGFVSSTASNPSGCPKNFPYDCCFKLPTNNNNNNNIFKQLRSNIRTLGTRPVFTDEMANDIRKPKKSHRGIINREENYWKPKEGDFYEIPYIFSEATDNMNQNVPIAMKHIEDRTCIRFVPRTNEYDYIDITNRKGEGCKSWVGKYGGAQKLDLEDSKFCASYPSIIIHELMHALGFFHEHQRPDRDLYVKINLDNVQPWAKSNFDLEPDTINLDSPYDFLSIMHYRLNIFAVDRSKNTIDPIVENYPQNIGMVDGLSEQDVYQLNQLYPCDTTSTTASPPTDPPAVCEDIESSRCNKWSKKGHCTPGKSKYKFMEVNCKKTCNLCDNTVTVPYQNTCDDYYGRVCNWIVKKNKCNAYGNGCRKKCDICDQAQNTANQKNVNIEQDKKKNGKEVCFDILENDRCKRNKRMGLCSRPYIRVKCRQTCQDC